MVIAQCCFPFYSQSIFTCYFIPPLASTSFLTQTKKLQQKPGHFQSDGVLYNSLFTNGSDVDAQTIIRRELPEHEVSADTFSFCVTQTYNSSPRSNCLYRRRWPSSWPRLHSKYFNRYLMAEWRYGESFISCYKKS